MNKRTWVNSTLKYDPEKKLCWSISRNGNVIKHYGLPSYGVKREGLPDGTT